LTAATDIFANADNSKCPNVCFRPVGLALDSQNRMFVSSDTSGEIYILVKTGVSTTTTGTSTASPSPSPTKSQAGVGRVASAGAWFAYALGLFMVL
jgi:hypothetical protein